MCIRDRVETEQELIIIEEYISGLSLDAYLQKEGVLNEKDAIYVMLQPVSYTHLLCYRDLAPDHLSHVVHLRANGFFLPQTNVYCRRPKNLRITIFFLQKSLQCLCSDSRLMRPGRRLL